MKQPLKPLTLGLALMAAIATLVSACPWSALAYSTPALFAEAPSGGGGGERFFSGSPAEGYGCDVCHEDNPDQTRYPAYVSGLPLDGYALTNRREVVVSWPEFSARWRELRPDPTVVLDKDATPPAMGLIAEFVAESGKASGTIEIDSQNAGQAGRCEKTRPSLTPKLAAQLYQVRPGLDPIRVKPDSTGMLRCTARQLGQRCIVAMNSCGADEVRLIWTTPETFQGPIWFSAGFVATDAISGSFDRDAASELSIPLLPEDSEADGYQEVITGGCSTAPGPHNATAWPLALPLLFLLGGLRRRGAKAPTRDRSSKPSMKRSYFFCLLALCLASCMTDVDSTRPGAYPTAGLYTPKSALGASDPTDFPDPAAGLGERCSSPPRGADAVPARTGELTVTYQTQTLDGRYAPRNCTAVWVETLDSAYVATLEVAARLRIDGLVYFAERACVEKSGPDVVTSATIDDHSKPHLLSWTGVDFEGMPMPDGTYQLFIEVTETDKQPGELYMFQFEKNGTAYDMELGVEGALTSLALGWEPNSLGEAADDAGM